jgi:cytochrome c oxidase assembly protein subunit 15
MPEKSLSKRLFKSFAYITFVTTFLVIIAGSIVRTTQSGMGCPDWPRCFGYYIPPTDPNQVIFNSGMNYKKGMMIIHKDSLWRATSTFKSSAQFDRQNWEKYPKHNYAKFEAYQTWIEYINRLLGALLGVFVLGLLFTSFAFWNTKRSLIFLSAGLLFLTGFQAWLGKLVVDGNLIPGSITIHMLAALLLLALNLIILFLLNPRNPLHSGKRPSNLVLIASVALLFTLIQVTLGTQVREEIDVIAKVADFENRSSWIEQLSSIFNVHRSFSWVLVALNGLLVFRIFKLTNHTYLKRFASLTGGIIVLEFCVGSILSLAGMPAMAQPVHLLLATFLFASQVAIILEMVTQKRITA